MASLPRWNSIKGTSTLRDFFALGGIAVLLIVVAFEFWAMSMVNAKIGSSKTPASPLQSSGGRSMTLK